MSKKRCKSSESLSLQAVIEQQLAAAAEQILWLLEERRHADVKELKELVTEWITAAVERIFTVFEAAKREPEEPGGRKSPADVHQLLESQVEVPPEQQEWSSSLDQEDPEPPHIKEEQEELWTSQEGEQLQGLEKADITKLPFTPVPVKSEEDEEKPQSSQLHQSPTEEIREAEPLTSSSTQHMETEADGGECGGSEPASNSDPLLQPDSDEETSDSSETDVSDDEWIQPLDIQSNWNSMTDTEVLASAQQSSTCSEHGKTFCSKSSFSLQSAAEKPIICSVCSKGFHVTKDLNRHMKYHTGEKPFSCIYCTKCFTEKGNLKIHMRTHTGEKPYSCPFCGKCCAEKAALTKHMRVHTGEKPFSCNICGKSCAQKGNLKIHMRVHTGEKPFSCSVCEKSFTQHGALKRHLKLHPSDTYSSAVNQCLPLVKGTVAPRGSIC